MEKTFFFHTPVEPGLARYTIAGRFNGRTIDFSYSRCSERDQFSKKIGRNIAEGRLNSRKNVINVPLFNLDKSGKTFLNKAIELIKVVDETWATFEFANIKIKQDELV